MVFVYLVYLCWILFLFYLGVLFFRQVFSIILWIFSIGGYIMIISFIYIGIVLVEILLIFLEWVLDLSLVLYLWI